MGSWFTFHLVREEMTEYPRPIQMELLAPGEGTPAPVTPGGFAPSLTDCS